MDGNTYIPDWTEDQTTRDYLDQRDEERCPRCEEEKDCPHEVGDDYICQSCYEDDCERAEMLVEDQEMDRQIDEQDQNQSESV